MEKSTQIILAKQILSEANIQPEDYVLSLQGPTIIPTKALNESGRLNKKVRTELDKIGVIIF